MAMSSGALATVPILRPAVSIRFLVARHTQGLTVRNIVSQFRVVFVGLDVVCVKPTAALPALLAGVLVFLKYGLAPFGVHCSAVLWPRVQVIGARLCSLVGDKVLNKARRHVVPPADRSAVFLILARVGRDEVSTAALALERPADVAPLLRSMRFIGRPALLAQARLAWPVLRRPRLPIVGPVLPLAALHKLMVTLLAAIFQWLF